VTTTIVGAPPELIDAAWVSASLPLEAAVAFRHDLFELGANHFSALSKE
jgi:hypothetical protein